MSRIVIALGGNALGNNPLEQQLILENSINMLLPLLKGSNEIIITHGNGPQVGMISNTFNNTMSLDVCTAMSEGYIGFHISKIINKVLSKNNIGKTVSTIITQVLVDENDPSFNNPTKPIGKFYTKEESQSLSNSSKDKYIEDSGRGYRKVVASPKPIKIVELDSIKKLINKNRIVIACGGGGIPVFNTGEETVEAVIDKDYVSTLLAKEINADYLLILTTVKQVLINMGKENETLIGKISVSELQKHIEDNQFGVGSMLPKIQASIDFVTSTNKTAIITSLDNIENAIKGVNCTIIKKN